MNFFLSAIKNAAVADFLQLLNKDIFSEVNTQLKMLHFLFLCRMDKMFQCENNRKEEILIQLSNTIDFPTVVSDSFQDFDSEKSHCFLCEALKRV